MNVSFLVLISSNRLRFLPLPAAWARDLSLILLAVAADRKTANSARQLHLQPIKMGDMYRLAEIWSSGAAPPDDTMRREALCPTAGEKLSSPPDDKRHGRPFQKPADNSAQQLPELTRIEPPQFRCGVA